MKLLMHPWYEQYSKNFWHGIVCTAETVVLANHFRKWLLGALCLIAFVLWFALEEKKILHITFIDYSQAYKRVPWRTLLRVLYMLGCGLVMLCALVAMYRITQRMTGTIFLLFDVGVWQHSPKSCLLFIVLDNDFIWLTKEGLGPMAFWHDCISLFSWTIPCHFIHNV